LIYARDWVINSPLLPSEKEQAYKEMQYKILTLFAARNVKLTAGGDTDIYFSERLDKYFDRYAETTMNATLADKYAKMKHGEKPGKKLSCAMEIYEAELDANGLSNTTINIPDFEERLKELTKK
jgi:hypothetical protein